MTRNEEEDRHTMQRIALALEVIAEYMSLIYKMAEKEVEDDSGEAD
jgi:hypothetical protein